MSAYAQDSRVCLSYVAAKKEQVDEFTDVLNSVSMLRQSHGPAYDCAMRLDRHLADLSDPVPRDAALFLDLFPVSGPYVLAEFLEAAGMAANELPVQHLTRRTILGFDHGFNYPLQQCNVAVDADLQQAIRQPGTIAQQVHRLLRMFESQ